MATTTTDGAGAPAPAWVPPGESEMLAGTPSFDVISNYKGWIASKEYRAATAEIAKRMVDEGIEGVYFVCPSMDGRPVGKFVATNSFESIANKGMNLHPMALTDFRADVWDNPIGFVEEDREAVMVPDLSTFRRFPWEPRLSRVFCFYYDGELEHTVNPLAFYEIAFIEEWEPLLLDLIEYGRAMGITVTHADSEDKSQIELNQAPNSPLAYVDNFYTYRQLCRIVARKHGMIATFMAKPFMGVSANGHHHSLSLMNESGENVLGGDLKGDCALSEDGVHLLGGLIDHADALTLIGAPTANSYKRFWDVGLWAPFHKSYGFDNRACLFRVRPTPTIEARGIDASCNPYLTVSSCLVAGLDGIRKKVDPGDPVQGNVMHDLTIPREERIPITLTEAIEAFKGDELMHELFQKEMYDTFVGLRQDDLNRYWSHVSQWEHDFYLERLP